MDIINLSCRGKYNLNKYELHKDIENSESVLYIYNNKELIKIINNKDFLNYKLYVINKLCNLKNILDLEELVLPNSLVKHKREVIGYTMDFVKNNTNVGLILNNNKINFIDKKFILKEIANILKKIEDKKILRQLNFYLGDIHEYNFIYDNKEKHLKVIDIDSSYFEGAKAPISKFLTYNDKLWDFNIKYPIDNETKNYVPNKNTTVLSYIYILLNTITGEYIPNISVSEFCRILNMLNAVGINKELLDSIFNIYLPKDNFIDYELIDSITEKQYNKFKELQLRK